MLHRKQKWRQQKLQNTSITYLFLTEITRQQSSKEKITFLYWSCACCSRSFRVLESSNSCSHLKTERDKEFHLFNCDTLNWQVRVDQRGYWLPYKDITQNRSRKRLVRGVAHLLIRSSWRLMMAGDCSCCDWTSSSFSTVTRAIPSFSKAWRPESKVSWRTKQNTKERVINTWSHLLSHPPRSRKDH